MKQTRTFMMMSLKVHIIGDGTFVLRTAQKIAIAMTPSNTLPAIKRSLYTRGERIKHIKLSKLASGRWNETPL